MPKYGYLRQDDDSHWYLVPEETIGNFDNMLRQIEDGWQRKDDLIDMFIEAFDKYRLSGGYQDLKILMDA
jgi:hypothetical protein